MKKPDAQTSQSRSDNHQRAGANANLTLDGIVLRPRTTGSPAASPGVGATFDNHHAIESGTFKLFRRLGAANARGTQQIYGTGIRSRAASTDGRSRTSNETNCAPCAWISRNSAGVRTSPAFPVRLRLPPQLRREQSLWFDLT